MTRKELEQIVIEAIGKACKAEVNTITLDTKWKEDLNIRSVLAIKVVALIKMKAGVELPLNELTSCITIRDTVDKVEALQ